MKTLFLETLCYRFAAWTTVVVADGKSPHGKSLDGQIRCQVCLAALGSLAHQQEDLSGAP